MVEILQNFNGNESLLIKLEKKGGLVYQKRIVAFEFVADS